MAKSDNAKRIKAFIEKFKSAADEVKKEADKELKKNAQQKTALTVSEMNNIQYDSHKTKKGRRYATINTKRIKDMTRDVFSRFNVETQSTTIGKIQQAELELNRAYYKVQGQIMNFWKRVQDENKYKAPITPGDKHEFFLYILSGKTDEFFRNNVPAWLDGDIEFKRSDVEKFFRQAVSHQMEKEFGSQYDSAEDIKVQLKATGGKIMPEYDAKKMAQQLKEFRADLNSKLGQGKVVRGVNRAIVLRMIEAQTSFKDYVAMAALREKREQNDELTKEKILEKYAKFNAAQYMVFGFSYATDSWKAKTKEKTNTNRTSVAQTWNISMPTSRLAQFGKLDPDFFNLVKSKDGIPHLTVDAKRYNSAQILRKYYDDSSYIGIHNAIPEVFYMSRNYFLTQQQAKKYTETLESSNRHFEFIHFSFFGDYRIGDY